MMNQNHNVFLKETPAHLFTGREDEAGKRIGEMILPCNLNDISKFEVVIIGIAEYAGIVRNGGKISPPGHSGTSEMNILNELYHHGAPRTVRERLYSMTGGAFNQKVKDSLAIGDLGDIRFDPGDVEGALKNLKEVLALVYGLGVIPIVIGGGHHISISSIGALAESDMEKSIAAVVVDAHSDFRPLTDKPLHSGVPFRYLLQNFANIRGEYFVELGLRPERNAALYLEELKDLGAHIYSIDDVRVAPVLEDLFPSGEQADRSFLSVDIDAFDIHGASASYPGGMSASVGRNIAYWWGAGNKTAGMDLVEINPLIHRDSSELGAQLIWSFLAGMSQRKYGSDE